MAQILDGRLVSQLFLEDIKQQIAKSPYSSTPKLVVILVGDNPSSLSYVKQKKKSAIFTGLDFDLLHLSEETSQKELLSLIQNLNQDNTVHGIIVQLPLPPHIDVYTVLKEISPRKDVDGFHAYNLGNMLISHEFENLAPCTPKGVIYLLDHYNIDVKGKNVVVVGRSNIVGKPMAAMLVNRAATVTVCHKQTQNLSEHTKNADILITATGVPGLITGDMVKERAVVVDIGITKTEKGLRGDVDFDAVKEKASFITPVPGGVGPMTVACLIQNTVYAHFGLEENNYKLV